MARRLNGPVLDRRGFLGGVVGALAASSIPARAGTSAPGKRFLIVNASGGWDPLCVFAPLFGLGTVDMEPNAEPWSVGNLRLVDAPGRPAVRSFFERYVDRTLLLNGVAVRSVNHETCATVMLTGATSDERPDWATLLAHGGRAHYDLPHLVMSGPVFPGPYGVLVNRAEGALSSLVRGELLGDASPSVQRLGAPAGRRVDHFLEQRYAAVLQGHPDNKQAQDLHEGWRRSRRLLDQSDSFAIDAAYTFRTRAETAITALSTGLSRCASVDTGFGWDTHIDNNEQIGLFQDFFTDLARIVELLDDTPGPTGAPLADDTVLVVLSEMARTPIYNGTGGRDHWPFTSMMMIGPGVVGNRTVGAYTDGYLGIGVDAKTGELAPAKPGISTEDIGATLLALGDMDPGELLPNAEPLLGLLA